MQSLAANNMSVLKELEKGDLVEFLRGSYSHWGVYVGENKIVHVSKADNNCYDTPGNVMFANWFTIFGVHSKTVYVKVDFFWDVAKDSVAKKNNDKDKMWNPLPPQEIKDRALSRRGPISYSVLRNDGKHFAAWCRYNRHCSVQEDFLAIGAIVAQETVLAVEWITYVVYNGRRNALEIAAAKKKKNEDLLRDLEVGDLVEFPRGLYSHWGVYIGENEIVHMCRDDANDADGNAIFRIWSTLFGDNNASVKREDFWTVVKDSIAKKNNSKDDNCNPLDSTEIKERAVSKIGPISYSLLWNNCEQFAAWCRYDRHSSKQVGLQQFMCQLVPTNPLFGTSNGRRRINSTQENL